MTYDGTGRDVDYGDGIAVAPGGKSVYSCSSSTGKDTGYDVTTIAYGTRSGAERWVSRVDGPSHFNDYCRDITVDPAGQMLYVLGALGEERGLSVFAVDRRTGNTEWSVDHSGQGFGAALSPDGGSLYVVGEVGTKRHQSDFLTVAYATR
jgi:DNA-binding beta-propeller fold protein YncE